MIQIAQFNFLSEIQHYNIQGLKLIMQKIILRKSKSEGVVNYYIAQNQSSDQFLNNQQQDQTKCITQNINVCKFPKIIQQYLKSLQSNYFQDIYRKFQNEKFLIEPQLQDNLNIIKQAREQQEQKIYKYEQPNQILNKYKINRKKKITKKPSKKIAHKRNSSLITQSFKSHTVLREQKQEEQKQLIEEYYEQENKSLWEREPMILSDLEKQEEAVVWIEQDKNTDYLGIQRFIF